MISFLARALVATMLGASAVSASADPISFKVDCMVRSRNSFGPIGGGEVLADLGSLGKLTTGSYVAQAFFHYQDLVIQASIASEPTQSPVTAPVLQLITWGKDGPATAMIEVAVGSGTDVDLWEPTHDVRIHCMKASMN